MIWNQVKETSLWLSQYNRGWIPTYISQIQQLKITTESRIKVWHWAAKFMMQIFFFSDLKAWDFMHKGCRLKNLQLLNLVYIYLAIENSKPNNKMLEDNCFPRESPLLIVKDVWNIPQM